MKKLVYTLPSPRIVVMRYLFAFLNHLSQYSDENLMYPYNLAVCFGPALLPIPSDKDQVGVCGYLFTFSCSETAMLKVLQNHFWWSFFCKLIVRKRMFCFKFFFVKTILWTIRYQYIILFFVVYGLYSLGLLLESSRKNDSVLDNCENFRERTCGKTLDHFYHKSIFGRWWLCLVVYYNSVGFCWEDMWLLVKSMKARIQGR